MFECCSSTCAEFESCSSSTCAAEFECCSLTPLAAMATPYAASPPVYIYVYWDNSNIFLGAKTVVEEQEPHIDGVRFRVRIDFQKLLKLATAGRPVKEQWPVALYPQS